MSGEFRRYREAKKLNELRDLNMVFGMLHAMSKGTLISWAKDEVTAELSDVSLASDVFGVCNRPPRARNYIYEPAIREVALLLSLRSSLEVDLQVKCSKAFPGRVCIDISLEASRLFVKWNHTPLSAPNNNDTDAGSGGSFKRDRGKVGDVSLAAATKEVSDEYDGHFLLVLEQVAERHNFSRFIPNLYFGESSNSIVRWDVSW